MLRQHDCMVKNPFGKGSVSSACMHYGGLVGDHTTSSMVISLEKNRTVVWSTGSSLPCVSLFKPWIFGTEEILPIVPEGSKEGEAYWLAAEKFRRNLLGKQLPDVYYQERDTLQNRWITQAEKIAEEAISDFSRACLEEEQAFFEKWSCYDFKRAACAPGFSGRWEKKNKILWK